MKWLNKRKPVMAKTVWGFKRIGGANGPLIDFMTHSHNMRHGNWINRKFLKAEVFDTIQTLYHAMSGHGLTPKRPLKRGAVGS